MNLFHYNCFSFAVYNMLPVSKISILYCLNISIYIIAEKRFVQHLSCFKWICLKSKI